LFSFTCQASGRLKDHHAIPFKIQKSEDHALLKQVDEGPHFYSQLHYHPEFQITAIVKGEGIFYAGNGMTSFTEKDVFIIGTNVPHLFKCSQEYYTHDSPGVKGISLFFDELSFGKSFFEIKEMDSLKHLLLASYKVVKISGASNEMIFNQIVETPLLQNTQLVITFLEILALAHDAEKTYLNGDNYNISLSTNEGGRLNKVLDYTFKHFREVISIPQIAKIAYLSRSQFSAFFKRHTGKSYIRFLNELRIENACILLKNKSATIEQVCYEVGFQNVSNFIRQFKKIKGSTPSQYRKSMTTL